MKKQREMPLGEALDEIESTVQRLKKEGSARANGYEVKLDEPVVLEIESEAEKGKAELDFEIKWQAERKRGGGRRRLLLGMLAGAAAGAVALTVIRRRRGAAGAAEEDEF
jgi:hypothetical protein